LDSTAFWLVWMDATHNWLVAFFLTFHGNRYRFVDGRARIRIIWSQSWWSPTMESWKSIEWLPVPVVKRAAKRAAIHQKWLPEQLPILGPRAALT
jgi:hypothetical protein